MNVTIPTIILLGGFVLLLLLRVPITFSLATASIATAFYLHIPLMAIVQQMVQGVKSFSLLAIPFFIIAGEMMARGGIAEKIINLANVLVGRVRGGLGMVNVVDSMLFGGISGSAVADVASTGVIIIPLMNKNGYDNDFSVAITVTSATQGIIIPPSHNMIIYSVAAGGVSVGRLFLGGYIPGILLGISLAIIVYILSVKRNYPKGRKYSFKEGIKIAIDAFWGLFVAVIIIVGVVAGVFTATESAAVAAVYAFIITFFVYKQIPLREFRGILYSTLKTLTMVMTLIATASSFSWLMAYLRIPAMATEFLLSITDNKYMLLFLVNVLLLFLGMIMDMAPLILIVTPILYPVLIGKFGMSPIHFGIMLMINLAIGLCTPPVGSALFVGCAVGKISIEKATKAMIPFYIAMVATLFLVTYVPEITMFLPNLIMPGQ